ncbi:hypothetical protein [Paracoccus alkanivorans]|nr:hypothetical protein [Paracoccus alkanivorans]
MTKKALTTQILARRIHQALEEVSHDLGMHPTAAVIAVAAICANDLRHMDADAARTILMGIAENTEPDRIEAHACMSKLIAGFEKVACGGHA